MLNRCEKTPKNWITKEYHWGGEDKTFSSGQTKEQQQQTLPDVPDRWLGVPLNSDIFQFTPSFIWKHVWLWLLSTSLFFNIHFDLPFEDFTLCGFPTVNKEQTADFIPFGMHFRSQDSVFWSPSFSQLHPPGWPSGFGVAVSQSDRIQCQVALCRLTFSWWVWRDTLWSLRGQGGGKGY